MRQFRRVVRSIIRKTGYDIIYHNADPQKFGIDAITDIQYFLKGRMPSVILDVGANVGQTANKFLKHFPTSVIYSFEPNPDSFIKLQKNCTDLKNHSTWNYGVGDIDGHRPLFKNTNSEMDSFLEPNESPYGRYEKKIDIEIITLDSFVEKHNINSIDILKSDTQGYELQVFKGASKLMAENKISIIYCEIIFSKMYKNLITFDVIYKYLVEHNFSLVAFYKQYFENDLLSWTDVLFINNDYLKSIHN